MDEIDAKIDNLAELLYLSVDQIRVSDYDENIFETPVGAYMVLSDYEADKMFKTYEKDLIEDIGLDAFSPLAKDEIIENYIISTDELEDYMLNDYEEYFNDIKHDSPSIDGFKNRCQEELAQISYTGIPIESFKEYFELKDFIKNQEKESAEDKNFNLTQAYKKLEDYKDVEEWLSSYDDNEDDLISDAANAKVDEYSDNLVQWLEDNFGKGEIIEALKNGYYGLHLDIDGICKYIKESDGRGPSLAVWNGDEQECGEYYAYQQDDKCYEIYTDLRR
jgi:hypothetical protein